MSPIHEAAELLRLIEEALDAGNVESLADLDFTLPPEPMTDLGSVAELDRLLSRTNQLRSRIASSIDDIGAELRTLDSKRTAGRAYISAPASTSR